MARKTAFALLLLTLTVTACQPAEESTASSQATTSSTEAPLSEAEAKTIVDRMIEAWDAATLAGDFEAASETYTTDAIRMQPDMPPLVGREAIRAWLQTQADTYSFEGTNEILEVRALSPEWILFRSTGSFTATPKAGGAAQLSQEKWLSLAQRQPDGTWKVYRDGGSSELPR